VLSKICQIFPKNQQIFSQIYTGKRYISEKIPIFVKIWQILSKKLSLVVETLYLRASPWK
jgi:hypothetical protein